MLVNEKSRPTAPAPLPGALGGLWLSLQPKEVADAITAGSGPSMPNNSGTPTLGTIKAGMLVFLNSLGQLELMSSPDLSVSFPVMPFVVFSGDDNFTGALVGDALVYHGGARLDTDQFDPAGSYVAGTPLVASVSLPGKFAPKGAVGDRRQIVGFVGPKMVQDGVLDVIMPQGVCGY